MSKLYTSEFPTGKVIGVHADGTSPRSNPGQSIDKSNPNGASHRPGFTPAIAILKLDYYWLLILHLLIQSYKHSHISHLSRTSGPPISSRQAQRIYPPTSLIYTNNRIQNVRTRPRINPYQRRPAQQTSHQTPRRDSTRRTRHANRVAFPRPHKRN